MNTTLADSSVSAEPAVLRAWTGKKMIYVELTNGRIVGFPAVRYKRLKAMTDEQLKK
jgi:hypothetical protein